MNTAELIMRRRNVREFIDADPVSVEFSRKGGTTKTAAGGYTRDASTTLPSQRGRIVQNKRRYNNGIINAEAGDLPKTDYLLIMTYDKDVRVDDEFKWLGENYHVTGIHTQRTESILCSIEFNGPDNRARPE